MTKDEFEAQLAAIGGQTAQPEAEKKKKVAILGFTDSRMMAPFNDPAFEVWGLNDLYNHIPRWDRWFELHNRAVYENDRHRTDNHLGKLAQLTCPVYMQQHYDDIPNSVPYPLDVVSKTYPNPCPEARPYLTNSITYMILLAVLEGFEEMHIYGVDMAHSSEYGSQRPSCEWAVGIAQGKGIRLYVPAQADLLKCNFLYGYEQDRAAAFDAKLAGRIQEMNNKLGELDKQMEQLIEMRAQYRGAVQDAQHILANWKSN